MKKKRDNFLSRLSSGESGQALIVVLIFLMLGSLTLVPTLTHISTALKTGEVYEENTNEMYAADSGIEDAIWRIKYDQIDPAYHPYDYDTIWEYQLDDHINNATTNVTIQNVWIPSNVDPPADPIAAEEIIKENKLVVAGTSSDINTTCKIVISFYPETGENLTVNSIGVWLPQGFAYVPGSSNLEQEEYAGEPFYIEEADVSDHAGGQAIIWDFGAAAPFTSFPGVDDEVTPQVTEITFQIDKDVAGTRPTTMISWLVTDDYATISDLLPVTWDVDTRIFKISSVSGDTEIEAYSSRRDLRNMLDAIAGDYIATGNTALYASTGSSTRNTWTNSEHSSAQTVSTIPHSDNAGYADVISAYLYWSGWFNEGTKTSVSPFPESCNDFTNWSRYNDAQNQTRLPINDTGDSNGTWNSSPYWSKVDETSPGDSDYITGTTSGGYKLFPFNAFTIPGGSPIANLTIYFRARDDSSGDNNIRASISVNGSRYDAATGVNPGSSFTTYSCSFTTNPNTGSSWTVDDINGSGTSPLQQFGVYGSDMSPGIRVSLVYAEVNFSTWSFSAGQFYAKSTSAFTTAHRTITLKNSLNIPYSSPQRVMASWYQNEDGNLESNDGLDYSFSTDGSNWSEDFEAFRGDLSSAKERNFKVIIPTDYQSSTFKIRFKLVGFNESDDNYCYLDNIKIEKVTPDNNVTFKIKDTETLVEHTETITADRVQVLPNSDGDYLNHGYSYSSFADVTGLVNTWCETAEDSYHNIHLTGNAEYTVGDIWASTSDSWSYAGWSIIIVYASPKTAGHQLYLYDNFMYADEYTDVDFDGDGEMGGTISGFKVPEKIAGDTDPNAGKLTCFIGEGDVGTQPPNTDWGDDFIAFNAPESYWSSNETSPDPFTIPNGYKLYDGQACLNNSLAVPNNVWNNKSPGLTRDGIDIDTFNIPWATEAMPWFLEPGDASAHIDIPTQLDSWNLVYMILSFRSKTVIGGTTHYVIHNN